MGAADCYLKEQGAGLKGRAKNASGIVHGCLLKQLGSDISNYCPSLGTWFLRTIFLTASA